MRGTLRHLTPRKTAATVATERKRLDEIVRRLAAGRVVFIHSPAMWAECSLPVKLQWVSVRFAEESRRSVPPDKSGIYAFVLEPDFLGPPKSAYVLYIGKAEERRFQRRFGDYLYEKSTGFARPAISRMLEKWAGHISFHYAPVDDVRLIPHIEETLVNACIPPFNATFTGSIGEGIRAFKHESGG